MLSREMESDNRTRFASIWSTSRADAGKTREYMADGLKVSVKTIQNWEKGATSPDFFQGTEWFRVLGLNPIPYYLAFLFPDMFQANAVNAPADDEEEIEQTLMLMIKNSTMLEKRELLYLMAGDHGSSWYSLLQMFTAHVHTSLRSRTQIAKVILDNYKLESELDELVCRGSVMPDIQLLEDAISAARESVVNGHSGYTSALLTEDESI